MKYYLLCNYYNGLYSHEQRIKFQTYTNRKLNIRDCIVRRSHIIKLEDNSGLVKLSYARFNNHVVEIGIRDCVCNRVLEFNVPRDNIQER